MWGVIILVHSHFKVCCLRSGASVYMRCHMDAVSGPGLSLAWSKTAVVHEY
jgi:hypothetical protein